MFGSLAYGDKSWGVGNASQIRLLTLVKFLSKSTAYLAYTNGHKYRQVPFIHEISTKIFAPACEEMDLAFPLFR